MGAVDNPRTWVPYVNTKDCSQGFCSMYCPQWCYIIFPPPPPPFDFPDDDSGPNFSPLVIAIIGILASAFLLVTYYAIISKFCGNGNSSSRRRNDHQDLVLDVNRDPSDHHHPNVSTNGLDEVMIKSITMFKYTKGDGLIEGTECSVCLSEFQENESLRLLPKCSHAFHVACIDTWLKSHSNCPLCRANIVVVDPTPHVLPPPVMEPSTHDIELGVRAQESQVSEVPTSHFRARSDHGNFENRSSIIDIRVEEEEECEFQVRRSISMDNPSLGRVSIADILRSTDDDVGTSTRPVGEMCRSGNRNKLLHCVTSPVAMKRSYSSGRLAFSKRGRGRNIM